MTPPISELDFVTIKTTLPSQPYPLNSARKPVKTERLILRPFEEDDLHDLHKMRLQPEVMMWTSQGVPIADLDATRINLAKRLPPNDATCYDVAIVEAATGTFIGCGGSPRHEGFLGWPEIGYLLCKEAWGKGYASEFLKAYMKLWWALPRCEIERNVDRSTICDDDGEVKHEKIVGVTDEQNQRSQHVLQKAGFDLAKVWTAQEDIPGREGRISTIYGYTLKAPT